MNRFHIRRQRKVEAQKKQNLCWKRGLLLVEMAAENIKQIPSLHLIFVVHRLSFLLKESERRVNESLDALIHICASSRSTVSGDLFNEYCTFFFMWNCTC